MSADLIKELFRNVENVLHDRLKVIEELLTSGGSKSGNTVDSSALVSRLSELDTFVHSVESYAMGEVRTLAYNHDMLEKRVVLLESSLRKAAETLLLLNDTVSFLQKRMDDERPVEAAEVEAEIEETQKASMEEQEVEEEEEEEEVELESFEYQKRSYARDQDNNVYSMDDEGAADVSQIVGIWNPKTKKIEPVEEEKELEIESFEYRKRSYARDQDNNVYSMDDEGAADVSQIVGIWNPSTKKIEPVPSV